MTRPNDQAYLEEQEAARQLRAEGTMWATTQEILDRAAANREERAREVAAAEQSRSAWAEAPEELAAPEEARGSELDPEHEADPPSEEQPAEVGSADSPSGLPSSERHRVRGLDERPPRRGRPPIEPPWLQAAARLVAYGTPLRKALWELNIRLSERERKNIYRLVRWRYYYEAYRFEFLNKWGARVSPR